MRQKRSKSYRKLMQLYCMTFGFRLPYQVLVDSEMCKEAVSGKIDLTRQLQNVLHGSIRPMITQCSIHSLYIAGRQMQPVVDLAKTLERRKCNHREARPEEECIKDVIGEVNKHRYVVASQTVSLRQYLRSTVPATPLVHITRSVMILEPISAVSERVKILKEEESMRPTETEAAEIKAAISSTTTNAANAGSSTSNAQNGVIPATTASQPPSAEPAKRKKRKGPKGPNPLSVKKKKKKPGTVERERAAAAKEREKRRVLAEAKGGRRKGEGAGSWGGREDKGGAGKDTGKGKKEMGEAGTKNAGTKRKRELMDVDGDRDAGGHRGKIVAPASGPASAGPSGNSAFGKRRAEE